MRGEGGARQGGRVRVDLIGERSEVGSFGAIKFSFPNTKRYGVDGRVPMRLDVLVLHRRLVEADARELRGELRDVGGELLDRRVGLLVERRLEVGELLADARRVDLLRDLDAAVDELGDL